MKSILVRVALGLLGVVAFSACNREDARLEQSALPSPVTTNAPDAGAHVRNQYEILKGKWERPDGGYIFEIQNVDADGKMEAGYFNPSPIKLSQARAYSEGGATKVFAELRDVNYPGCTYKLTYDAKSDQLFGQYYQAAMQETYDVAFSRVK